MEMDLDLTEIGLDMDVDNLKLLQKQFTSMQNIRYEQQRKDELIYRLKERIKHLEQESHSYEDIKEHVLNQSRRVMEIRDQEMTERLSATRRQMELLVEQVEISEEKQQSINKR